jgi:hypothetical protein
MPITKEFALELPDQPGTLGKLSQALGERGVNILAFQAVPGAGQKSTVRMVVDNPTSAKSVLDSQGMKYNESEVAQVKLPHRPGELARAASRLGTANININYAYTGLEPESNAPVLIFGVADARKAASILDEVAAKAA